MAEENISQEFRLTNIDETKNLSIKEINQNDLIGKIKKKKKKKCIDLNYIRQWMCFHFCFCFV